MAHLVLGQRRPRTKAKAKRKGHTPATLAPGIEERVQLHERWSHKQGTPETLEHVATARPGSLYRLYQSGAINAEQLQAAVEIATVYERIGADVAVRTGGLEARIDRGWREESIFVEGLGRIRHERAYTCLRQELGRSAAVVLDMIAGDVGVTIAAARHGMHHRRAKAMLVSALDRWQHLVRLAVREIDEASVALIHAALV